MQVRKTFEKASIPGLYFAVICVETHLTIHTGNLMMNLPSTTFILTFRVRHGPAGIQTTVVAPTHTNAQAAFIAWIRNPLPATRVFEFDGFDTRVPGFTSHYVVDLENVAHIECVSKDT